VVDVVTSQLLGDQPERGLVRNGEDYSVGAWGNRATRAFACGMNNLGDQNPSRQVVANYDVVPSRRGEEASALGSCRCYTRHQG
jgi:hypothetical protein